MAAIKKLLLTKVLDQFSAVRLSFQACAEIDPTFVERHRHNFKETLNVITESGDVHELKCVKNYYNPIITDGWTELKEFHQFPDNVEVVFKFYGNNIFEVAMFKEVECVTKLPRFHSRSAMLNQTKHFDLTLHELSLVKPLLWLPKQFGEYLKNIYAEHLCLCDDRGETTKFEVFLVNDYEQNVQIGLKWDEFCKSNNFRARQTIRFKCEIGIRNMCHVYLNERIASTSNPTI